MHSRRCRIFLLLASSVLFFNPLCRAEAKSGSHERKAAENEVIVKFNQISPSEIATLTQTLELTSIRPLGGIKRLYHLRSRSKKIDDLIAKLSARADVAYAEPNFQWQAIAVPNDPQFANQWALQNTGQYSDGFSTGLTGADISAVSAWDISTGGTAHVVGIVDTGIDYTHPDLQPNVWSAPTDFTIMLNGASLTCPTGSHGYNAITGSCDPMDDYMHGTHVSGIIGAAGNNNLGVVGVNWTTRIMGLKFLDSQGYGYTSDAVSAIEFAIQVKAAFASSSGADLRILSNSWGGGAFSQALQDEVDRAAENDILFVAAAGNNGANIDTSPMYPASFNRPNMIAVAATDNNDALAIFSNYGPRSVHLGAPGVDILSTLPNGIYAYLSGTSMATPFVSGAAALTLSACDLPTSDLKKIILDNVDPVSSLAGQTISGGRLNVNHAIRSCSGPVGLSPSSASFVPLALQKASPPRVITLRNYQNATLNIAGIFASGDFAETNDCGSTLAPKAACNIAVTFTPSSTGARTGQLQVIDDAPNNPQLANLDGTGVFDIDLIATVSTSATAISPGTAVPLTVTVANQGTADSAATVAGMYLSSTGLKDSTAVPAGDVNVPQLAAGTNLTTQTSMTIPANIALGSYYLLVCADDTNVVAETNESNNCGATGSALNVHLADLLESSVNAVRTGPQALLITDTALNQGAAAAPASITQFYAANYPAKSTSARQLAGSRAVPQLALGATSVGTTIVSIPQDLVGNLYVLACADDTNVVTESNETNNCASSTTRMQFGPDLVESGISTQVTATGPGASFTVSDSTRNQGAGSATASTTQYYLSPLATRASTMRVMSGARAVPALDAGASSAGGSNVTVPADMPAGSYFILACADDTNVVPETNETNNCAASYTRIQVGPDLIESGVSSQTTLTGPGATLTVADTTRNQGAGNADISLTQYYLSPLTIKASNARLLTGTRSVPALAAGALSSGSASVVIPGDIATGTYYLLACADDSNLVPEANETNNCAAAANRIQVGPDLIESAVSIQSTITGPGASIMVSDTAINQGIGTAAPSATQYYLSSLTSKSNSARLLSGSRSVPNLISGASYSGSANVIVPPDMATGAYYLLACADDTNLVLEANENNNCAAYATRIQVGPDLIESSVNSPTTIAGPGSTLSVTDVTINPGGGAAAASITQYYLSAFSLKTSAARLLNGNRSVAALNPGMSSAGGAAVSVPADMAAGNYYLFACADDTNLVAESNESNNCVAATSRIQVGPDLIENSVAAQATIATRGAAFSVTDKTVNLGGGNAGPSITQYYLSTFPMKNAAARLLTGGRSVSALSAGESSAGNASLIVPGDITPGSYYLLACADGTNLVPEANENNNCAASATKIQVPQ